MFDIDIGSARYAQHLKNLLEAERMSTLVPD
jgi:hypothetical protein